MQLCLYDRMKLVLFFFSFLLSQVVAVIVVVVILVFAFCRFRCLRKH